MRCPRCAPGGRRDGSKPRRSVFVYIPNGVNGMTWQCTKAGRDYELSPSLKPLAKHREDFTVFSGLHHPNGLGPGPRLRRHLAHRREDRRAERAEVREHRLRAIRLMAEVVGQQTRILVAGTLDLFRHGPTVQLQHARLLARRRAAAGRG